MSEPRTSDPHAGSGLIDIGVNLLHPQLLPDIDAVLERAWRAGLEHLIVTGTDLAVSRAALELCAARNASEHSARERATRLSATAGIHPHDARHAPPGWQDALRELARDPGVVAIGETGLDFHRNFSAPDLQETVFRDQVEIAADLALPLFVHDRDASDRVVSILRPALVARAVPDVVVHCFTGTRHALLQYLELGCHIGITGWVCDRRRGAALRALIPLIPPDRLLIETDAPFLRPQNAPAGPEVNPRRNEPALLGSVIAMLAELYQQDAALVGRVTRDNARRVFRLDAGQRQRQRLLTEPEPGPESSGDAQPG